MQFCSDRELCALFLAYHFVASAFRCHIARDQSVVRIEPKCLAIKRTINTFLWEPVRWCWRIADLVHSLEADNRRRRRISLSSNIFPLRLFLFCVRLAATFPDAFPLRIFSFARPREISVEINCTGCAKSISVWFQTTCCRFVVSSSFRSLRRDISLHTRNKSRSK